MTHQPSSYSLVSIITVNYNAVQVTREFLLSIGQITYPCFEVIVVDNASSEPGLHELIKEFPGVTFIKNTINSGFAGGNNLGLKAAKGDFILFINNDTEVEKSFLEPMVVCMQQDEQIGMVSPKIKYFHTPDIIQYAGGIAINPFTGRGSFIGNKQADISIYSENKATQLIHGAAMMVSRKLIQNVGTMYEAFFLYYEELDWCERAKKAGFQLYYIGQSVVYHKESASVGKNSPLRTYYISRNRLLFIRRNYRRIQKCMGLAYFFMIAFPKNIAFYLFTGRIDLMNAFFQGVFWHFNPTNWKLKP